MFFTFKKSQPAAPVSSDEAWLAQTQVAPPRTSMSGAFMRSAMGAVPVLVAGLVFVELTGIASPVSRIASVLGEADAAFEAARREEELKTQLSVAKVESFKFAAAAQAEIDKAETAQRGQLVTIAQTPEIIGGFADSFLCMMQGSYGPQGHGGETDFCSGVFTGGNGLNAEKLVADRAAILDEYKTDYADAYLKSGAPTIDEILDADGLTDREKAELIAALESE